MEKKQRRRWRRAALWAGIMLAVPITYTLNSGPLLVLAVNGWIPAEVFEDLYVPLRYATKKPPSGVRAPAVTWGLYWYWQLWLDPARLVR